MYTNSPPVPSGWLGGAAPFKELHYANALLHPHNEFTEDYYHNTVLFFTAVNTSIKRELGKAYYLTSSKGGEGGHKTGAWITHVMGRDTRETP